MKKIIAISTIALLAACAPASTTSSFDMDFAPASPLGARITGSGTLAASSSGVSRIRLELRGLPASSSLWALAMRSGVRGTLWATSRSRCSSPTN